jgi:Secretion system C-terminal sorting domain
MKVIFWHLVIIGFNIKTLSIFKMKKFSIILGCCISLSSYAQSLNWNTSGYLQNTLHHNFGHIGSPGSNVEMFVTGRTDLLPNSSPAKYQAGGPGPCGNICALRSDVDFTGINQVVTYSFTFSPAVSGLSFTIYDIDLSTDGLMRDEVSVSAKQGAADRTITMIDMDGVAPVTGSGTTLAKSVGNVQMTDNRVQVSISGLVNSVIISYKPSSNSTNFGTKSISIGNMTWLAILPSEIVSFSGAKQSNASNLLQWSTNNESNLQYFAVEKSQDGKSFTELAQIAATNQKQGAKYIYTDLQTVNANAFYRIKTVDKDGSVNYSQVIVVRNTKIASLDILVSPNPAADFLTISTNESTVFKNVSFYNTLGQKVDVKTSLINNQIDIRSLPNGFYSLIVENNAGQLFTKKFMKQ